MSQTGEQGLGRGERGKHLSPDTAASAARDGNHNLESCPLGRSCPGAPHIPTDWHLSGSTPVSFTILGFSRSFLRSPSYIDKSLGQEEPSPECILFSIQDLGGTIYEVVCPLGYLSRPEGSGPCKRDLAGKDPIIKYLFVGNGVSVWQIPRFVSTSICLPSTSVPSGPLP